MATINLNCRQCFIVIILSEGRRSLIVINLGWLFVIIGDGVSAIHHFIEPTFKFITAEIFGKLIVIACTKGKLFRSDIESDIGFDRGKAIG